MYCKIKNENFWKKVCKRLDDIFLVLESLIDIVERFVIQNFKKVSTFNESNCIIKYNRIFLICSEEKIFTMNFPFKILEGGILFDGEIIDINIIRALKIILSILKESKSYEDFLLEYDSIDDSEDLKIEEIQMASKILKKLFEIEIGYLRFDKDEEAAQKHSEQQHPEYHLDVFFDDDISMKLGIEKISFDFKKDIESIFSKLFEKQIDKFFLK